MIPQFKVRMAHDAVSLVKEVLDSGFIGQGSKVDYFEELLQPYPYFASCIRN